MVDLQSSVNLKVQKRPSDSEQRGGRIPRSLDRPVMACRESKESLHKQSSDMS